MKHLSKSRGPYSNSHKVSFASGNRSEPVKIGRKQIQQPALPSAPPPHLTVTTESQKFLQLPRDRPAESEQQTVSVKDKNSQQFVTSQRGKRNRAATDRFCGGRALIPSRSVRIGVLGTGL